ncbi:MAG: copper-binding protein [Proteobacteria bacterium]|nr:copper-binding protein [Pseudomonadota bacterium]
MAAQASAPAGDTAKSVKTGSAIGTIQSIDAAAGKITIAHGPIEALGWPGMTMAFKASPEQIASVKTGQKVKFDVQLQGSEATITKIAAAQ